MMTATAITPEHQCPQCGAPVEAKFAQGRFYPRKCDDCTASICRERGRLAAERKRRASGIAPAKGTEIICERCAEPFVRGSVRTKYCLPCRPVINLARANTFATAKRRDAGQEPWGTPRDCAHCGLPFKTTRGDPIYCRACRALDQAGKLPKSRAYRKRYQETVLRPKMQSDPAMRVKQRQADAKSRAKRKTNPSFKINERMSAGVRQSLKGGKNGARWEALVGYTAADLARHLERQFLPGMTWANFGGVHIDHIVPKVLFDFTSPSDPAFRACWALSNLRPLWKRDNLEKKDQRTHLL